MPGYPRPTPHRSLRKGFRCPRPSLTVQSLVRAPQSAQARPAYRIPVPACRSRQRLVPGRSRSETPSNEARGYLPTGASGTPARGSVSGAEREGRKTIPPSSKLPARATAPCEPQSRSSVQPRVSLGFLGEPAYLPAALFLIAAGATPLTRVSPERRSLIHSQAAAPRIITRHARIEKAMLLQMEFRSWRPPMKREARKNTGAAGLSLTAVRRRIELNFIYGPNLGEVASSPNSLVAADFRICFRSRNITRNARTTPRRSFLCDYPYCT